MGNDLFVDFPGEWALLALGYTQPLPHCLPIDPFKDYVKCSARTMPTDVQIYCVIGTFRPCRRRRQPLSLFQLSF